MKNAYCFGCTSTRACVRVTQHAQLPPCCARCFNNSHTRSNPRSNTTRHLLVPRSVTGRHFESLELSLAYWHCPVTNYSSTCSTRVVAECLTTRHYPWAGKKLSATRDDKAAQNYSRQGHTIVEAQTHSTDVQNKHHIGPLWTPQTDTAVQLSHIARAKITGVKQSVSSPQ